MTTPNITLTATLDDLTGAAAGTVADPAKLRIALCGFGPLLPVITGTAMIAKAGPFSLYTDGSSQISTKLWGNDQIQPAGTYYSIEVLDGQDNVVQCGAYQVTGSGTVDLSNLPQIVPPYGFALARLQGVVCPGTFPGSSYTAPGPVVAVFVTGLFQRPGIDYNMSGLTIGLTYTTGSDDNVYALCIL